MNLQGLINDHFRTQVADEDQPYLWSDPEALAFAIDAQDMFTRLTGGIQDITAAATDAAVIAGTAFADLVVSVGVPFTAHSPYWLRLRSARLVTGKLDVDFISQGDMHVVPTRDYGWTRGLTLDDTDVGDVRFAVLGIKERQVRWVRVPNVADTCRVQFMRLPYPRIVKQDDPLEITEEHHLHLVKWMKHLAYSKEDAETYDKNLAATNEASFRAYCEQARQEIERRRYKPRVVQFNCPGY